jgi:3-deoxy-manno-octulosonate cytidylyltransferase (CMP-KDO synthetase)
VVNVQGDEPLIPPEIIRQVAGLLTDDPDVGIATLCEPLRDLAQVFDPNVVKVVSGIDGFALYFSRAAVPYARDAFAAADSRTGPVPEDAWRRHIGISGYRVAELRRFVSLPVGRLERLESLEQLRLVEQGMGIRVALAAVEVPGGVDTPADLDRVRRIVREAV